MSQNVFKLQMNDMEDTKAYRLDLEYDELEEDLNLLEELIELEVPNQAGDDWVIE